MMMWPFGLQQLKQDLKQTNLEYLTSAPSSQKPAYECRQELFYSTFLKK